MTMTSYAQNGEDVMLMRALNNVAGGFYIDVGAADPTIVSVTRAFYERGWHGVNVEPTLEHHRRLGEARQRDVNLSQPVSERVAEEMFHFCEHPDLSTLMSDVANASASGGLRSESRVVQTTTLADICRRFAPPVIHFLKVDVEGAEESVLRGADFQRYRPWIVVVEATRPNTQIPAFADWEPILLDNRYRFVWFDGLNRFYLADEKFETLSHHFDAPVNVFDDYVRHDPALETLAAELAAARAGLGPLREAAAAAERHGAAAASDARALAEAAERERVSATARADAADAAAALLDARMRSSDALAQAAAVNAQAAEAQVFAARARLGDLQHEIDDTRRRHDDLRRHEEATRALLTAQQSESVAQLALARHALDEQAAAHDRANAERDRDRAGRDAERDRDHAERDAERARAHALDAEVEALRREVVTLGHDIAARDAPPPVAVAPQAGEIAPVPLAPPIRPSLRRRVAARLYGWTLRPVLRPLAWRGRSFLLAGLGQALEERGVQERQPAPVGWNGTELLGEVRRRQDRILDMVHRIDDLAAGQRTVQLHTFEDLRAQLGDAVATARRIEVALPDRTNPELHELAQSMEAALLTVATAGRLNTR